MRMVELYEHNGLSYFRERDSVGVNIQELGIYSDLYFVETMQFRDFNSGCFFDWHPAPRPQYIFYLSGSVQVEASSGETKVFNAGDILFANDTAGRGHTSKTIEQGRAVIVTLKL